MVHAKTNHSSASVGVADAAEALRRAHEMLRPGSTVTVMTPDGTSYTVVEFEALVAIADSNQVTR